MKGASTDTLSINGYNYVFYFFKKEHHWCVHYLRNNKIARVTSVKFPNTNAANFHGINIDFQHNGYNR